MMYREEIIEKLKTFLNESSDVLAVWEAGSKATGYVDEYSDLDLYITVKDDGVESLFQRLDAFLEEKYGIDKKFRLPEPTWHGSSQTFYQLKSGPSWFYLDVAVFKLSNPNKFMEKDRHGVADLWFEKEKVYDDTPTPKEQILKKNKSFYETITSGDFVTILEIEKAILRNSYLDAYPFYYSFIARNLVGMLNLSYRPATYDFGMRYISRTYSSDDKSLIKNSLGVKTIAELSHQFELVKARYFEVKDQLKHLK